MTEKNEIARVLEGCDIAGKRVLELGCALGYTACCLATGSPHAHVDTIEGDPVHVELARAKIAEAGLSDRIAVHAGEFARVLADLTPGYDLVFFDGYAPDIAIMRSLATLLAPQGVLVCANLGLMTRGQASRMLASLAESGAWSPLPSIEGGATAVWIRG